MHSDELVKKQNFVAYGPEWPPVYFHAELQLMLSIYVDDFKLAGPKENLAKGWALLKEVIELDEPELAGLYLGCQQHKKENANPEGKKRTCMIYDMEAFMEQCLIKNTGTTGAKELRTCATPFWVGPENHGPAFEAYLEGIHPNQRTAADWMAATVPIDQPKEGLPGAAGEGWLTWSMDSDEESGCEGEGKDPRASPLVKTRSKAPDDFIRYASPVVPRTTGKTLPKEETLEMWDEPGVLSDYAASIVMKVMYGARMARVDLLRAVQGLARHLTKWTRRQDQELWRMMCYIKATKHWRLVGWIGDPLELITLTVFSDADFAGCTESRRCTSGGVLLP